jgi:membrane fusion protein, copper/silver efflux system
MTDARRRGLRGPLLFAVLAVLVAVAVWRFARRDTPTQAPGHEHGAAPTGDTALPVTLTAADAQRIGVTFAEVADGPIGHEVRVVGIVQADETRIRTVTSRVEGFVERLYVDFTGQPVRAGATLLELYAPMVVAAQEELLLARNLERQVASGTDDARAAAVSAVAAARQRLRQWEVPAEAVAEVERSGTPGRTFPLRSPYGGFVLEKAVQQGQRVMAGDLLYRIADLSVVWLEGEVFEQDLPLLRLGSQVVATFRSLPGVERRGRIAYVYPTLDPVTRTARVRVELANGEMALKPGMYATIVFTGESARGLSVPRSAVLATGTRNLVFLKGEGNRFEPREVVTGLSSDDRVQVLRGLAAGDTVVASATFLIDAESNLGSMLGGMGNMPGMDMGPPTSAAEPKARDSAVKAPPADTSMADMPGMDHSQHQTD